MRILNAFGGFCCRGRDFCGVADDAEAAASDSGDPPSGRLDNAESHTERVKAPDAT